MLGRINRHNRLFPFVLELAVAVLAIHIRQSHLGVIVRGCHGNDDVPLNGHRQHTKPAVINVLSNQIDSSRRPCDEFGLTTILFCKVFDQRVVPGAKYDRILEGITDAYLDLPLLFESGRIIDLVERVVYRYRHGVLCVFKGGGKKMDGKGGYLPLQFYGTKT